MSKLSDRLAEAKRNLGISTRAMSERAEANGYRLSNYTASVYTNGRHPVSADPDTLDALAFVLRIPRAEVRQLAGLPVDLGEFKAHESANMLTAPQRTAVNEIIRLLAEGNMQEAGDGRGEATPPNQAAGSAADQAGQLAADKKQLRAVPNPDLMAAYNELEQTELQRQDAEAEKAGEEDQTTNYDD